MNSCLSFFLKLVFCCVRAVASLERYPCLWIENRLGSIFYEMKADPLGPKLWCLNPNKSSLKRNKYI